MDIFWLEVDVPVYVCCVLFMWALALRCDKVKLV